MGRKAKPIDLILLEGNSNRLTKKQIAERKEREAQLQIRSDKIKPPSWLEEPAKKEFNRLVSLLQEIKLVTEADIAQLATYCDAYTEYIKCTKIIQGEGLMVEYTNKAAETNKVPHPLLTKKKHLFDQMRVMAQEFGFTPSARAKIAIPKKETKEPTELDKMFGDV